MAIALLVVSPAAAPNAKADDIPHENYELVKSNLDVVITLLKSAITYSEYALMGMYNESMGAVNENLTVVRGLLTPADLILADIKDIAESYENLSTLIPPFSDLSSQMDSFSSMESVLLGARDDVVSASKLASLTDQEKLAALEAITRVNSLMVQMNRTIDFMLGSATTIIGLEVDGERPFTENQLIELIEKLRELLYTIELEVELAVQDGIPWNETSPFSLLWLSASDYYLGESIVGGGYLYYNGSFEPFHGVTILMDGATLTSVTTALNGRFYFSYPIPIDASWLGSHTLQASSSTPTGLLNSSVVVFSILLVPTTISLEISETVVDYRGDFTANVTLEEVHGYAVADAECYFIVDGESVPFTTDANGDHTHTWLASDLGYGTHQIQALFDGELPYAASESATISFVIDIPTRIELDLVMTNFHTGYLIIGDGTLFANDTEPLRDQTVMVSIDGVPRDNITTNSTGKFGFSISSEGLPLGGHVLRAEFVNRTYVWRYSYNETGFSIHGLKVGKYPFFPVIPGWPGIFGPDTFPYLFIGSYAYFFWLLLLLLIGTAVKVIQTAKKRREYAAKKTEVLESLDKVVLPLKATAATTEDFVAEIRKDSGMPRTPNERIVWYYQRLLTFITKRERISLRASMTHWEVARTLKSVGYPSSPVDKMTVLFEHALYSGMNMNDEDTIVMSAALTSLVSVRKPEATHAI